MTVNKITSPIDSLELISKVNEVIDNLGGSSSLAGLSDVTLTSVAAGETLSYNGSKWVNSTPTTITFRSWS